MWLQWPALTTRLRPGTRFSEEAEHPFLYVKRHFGYARVRYRDLEKNRQRFGLLLGFANLLRAEPQLA